ncbi:MAG: NAD(P)H-dependent oxidoreductase [Rhodobacteraceae bacterium]|nr:NAD(P)H-dependent oxidoreductase [Paracoccaceae bacterium]
MSLKLAVITASTRPGRVGPAIAEWFADRARADGGFEVVPVDLADVGLPLYDEPKHPRLQDYQHEHTKRWSKIVDGADAFVFVAPEYNAGPTPALVNALNYVYREWNDKPAGFVSYGGVSGGLRAVQLTKPILTSLKLVPVVEAVTLPAFTEHMRDGKFHAKPIHDDSARALLAELHRWAVALKPMRAPAEAPQLRAANG